MWLYYTSLCHRVISWDLIRVLGQEERIRTLLGPRWVAALDCRWPQYRELTVEFFSTFRYDESLFYEDEAISFSLGRTLFAMSVP